MKKRKYQRPIKRFAAIFAFILLFLFFFMGCGKVSKKPAKSIDKFQIITEIKSDKNSPFYIDFKKFPVERKKLPIGIFDSGTGGLTVLNSILTLDNFNNKTHEPGSDGIPDFMSERFVYLGDKANMPYGRYDSEGKSDFLKELIIKDVQFLLRRDFYQLPGDTLPEGEKDPAESLAVELYTHLKQKELFCSDSRNKESTFFISVANPLLAANRIEENNEFSFSYKYGRSINQGLQFVKRVPFSRQWIKEEVLKRIQIKMPDIYRMVVGPNVDSDTGVENKENNR